MHQVSSHQEIRPPHGAGSARPRNLAPATPRERAKFIDAYLARRGWEPSEVNRIIVACGIDAFAENNARGRADLTAFLDGLYGLCGLQ